MYKFRDAVHTTVSTAGAVVVILLGLLTLSPRLSAQIPAIDPCSGGLSYLLAFPDTVKDLTDDRFNENLNYLDDRVYVFLYSAADSNTVTIIPNAPKGADTTTLVLRAGKFTEHPLSPKLIVSDVGKASRATYRIEAEQPILMYCYMATKYGGEAWTPLPVESWGTRYYAAALGGDIVYDILKGDESNYGEREHEAPAVITILAAYDSTHVIIYPNAPMNFNGTYTITLNAGDAYQYETTYDWIMKYQGKPQPDPGGSLITADKPIGVLSGNTRHRAGANNQMLSENSISLMLVEWLTPAEQHGTEFAYLPTWDSRRIIPGDPSQKIDENRKGEYIRVYGTSQGAPANGSIVDGTGNYSTSFSVSEKQVYQLKIDTPRASYIKTSRPTQVTMHSTPVSRFDSTFALPGGYTGVGYTGWGPYMTTLIPREQWISFVPFRGPTHPARVEEFVNVVAAANAQGKIFIKIGTDDWHPFTFNQGAIPGSDLVWGTTPIAPGVDYYLRGDNGATFSGHVYGLWRGYERFHPGKAGKKDDEDNGLASAGGRDQVLHPAEYYENNGLAFGYPLAFSHCAVVPPGIQGVDTSMGCTDLTVKVRLVPKGIGVASITLDPFTQQNAELVFVSPNSPSKLPGYASSPVEVHVVPIDPTQNAQATVLIQDRSRLGKTWSAQYRYEVERFTLNTNSNGELDLGNVRINTTVSRMFQLTNPTGKAIDMQQLSLLLGTQNITIDSTQPRLPAKLGPGETLKIWVGATPKVNGNVYYDTLLITTKCSQTSTPVRVRGVQPCIIVNDLDFGTLGINEVKTIPLSICNSGSSPVTFFDSTGNGLITWLETNFTVDPNDLAALQTATLDSGDCITVRVTFQSSLTGTFTTTARFWANTRSCRDTSNWNAVVTRPGPNISGQNWHDRWLTTRNECTKNSRDGYDTVIVVSNTGSQPFTVAEILLIGPDAAAGYFRLGNTPAIPVGTVIQPGDRVQQQVIFSPDAERPYTCAVRLKTTTGDTTSNLLNGIGVESHVAVDDLNFGTNEFRGAGTTSIPGTTTLRALPSRPLTVRELRLSDPTNFAFDLSSGFVPPVETDPTTWLTLAPGSSRQIPILFTPQDSGTVSGNLLVIGDHSRCDDSTAALTGATFGLSVRPVGFDFGQVLICFDSTGMVTLRNDSRAPVSIVDIHLRNASGGVFTLAIPPLPRRLDPGTTLNVPVTFDPSARTSYTDAVVFQVTNIDGTLDLGTIEAPLSGIGGTFDVRASIARNHSAFPGMPMNIPVRLDDALDRAQVSHLQFTLSYNDGIMRLTNGVAATIASMLQGTLLDGWTPTITNLGNGEFAVDLTAPAGTYLSGTGDLLHLEFTTYAGSAFDSELPFTIDLPDNPCAAVIPSDGYARLDSVCGMHLRLIEAFGKQYALEPPTPNPVSASTEIRFSLGLDGPTTLVLYNALGQQVATLVNGYMPPGTFQVTLDAHDIPAGLYYYRLISGVWSSTRTVVLEK